MCDYDQLRAEFGLSANAPSRYILGLFSGVIQESGAIINPWAVSYNPRELAFMLGEALGIHTTDSAELVQKLSEFHVKDIIAASDEIMKSQVRYFRYS